MFAATLLAFLPALAGRFIWNDSDYVTKSVLQSLAGLGRIWAVLGATEQYYPLLHTTFWVEHRLWGEYAPGYHLVTLLLHAGGAVLFGSVLKRLAVPGAWLAAGLFALHPVHVESVAWISEQKNTLALLFYLAAARAYLEFDSGRRPRTYGLAAAFFVLSLLCKTVTATLPAALLVVFWWQRGRLDWRRDFRPLLPWLLVGAAAGLLSSWIERHYGGAAGAEFTAPWLERGLIAGRAFWFYLGSLVWPFDLNFIYPRWDPDAGVAGQWLFPLGAAALAGGLWTLRRRTRAPLAAMLFFAGSLFPVLGFVNLYGARYSWVWDHWQYLPDLGPLALAGGGLALGVERLGAAFRRLGQGAVAVLLLLLAALTWQHSRIFHDDETLYRATLARNPGCWMAHNNLGNLLAEDLAREPEAITHYEAALRLKPDSTDAHNNLGNLLTKTPAHRAEAIAHYEAALRIDPNLPKIHNNLGAALRQAGDLARAAVEFQRALDCEPQFDSAALNLGSVLCALGRPAEALAPLHAVLARDPDAVSAYIGLGNALTALAQPEEALRHYREALRLDPETADVRVNLAALLLGQGALGEALALLQTAIVKDPGLAEAHYHLGNALLRAGNLAGGTERLREAARLKPDWLAPHYALGNALAQASDFTGAIAEYRRALAVDPTHFPARNNLANALLASGQTADAIREYETALRQRPDDRALRENLQYARELLKE